MEVYAANNFSGRVMPWRLALLWSFIIWYLWIPAVPLLVRVSARIQRNRAGWAGKLALYAATGLVFAACHSLLVVILYLLLLGRLPDIREFLAWRYFVLITDFLVGSVLCAAVLAAADAVSYYRRFEAGRWRAAHLESQLANAQLQALKMQLQPHFLFNTLHSVSALQMADVNAAQKMTARLGDFLRMTLNSTASQQVRLGQELEFVNCYLEIERIRFGERLAIIVDADPATLDAEVPNLLLQPLVENAIRHGVNAKIGPARLVVRSFRWNDQLRLQVQDDGPGIPMLENWSRDNEGVGLRNTRERLRQSYGSKQTLELHNVAEGGLAVDIAIPFERPAPLPEVAAHV